MAWKDYDSAANQPPSPERVAMIAKALLFFSFVVVALIFFFAVFFKARKHEQVWRKLGDSEPTQQTPTVITNPRLDVSGSAAEEVAHTAQARVAWQDSNYCWVVVCKNHWFHRRRNLFHGHRIPLGETDAIMSRPAIQGRFSVRCDDCNKEYFYRPSDVVRYEQELSESFVAHPLFR
jgi:hypothetical protein